MTLIGVDRAMACDELNQSWGAQVRLSWLRELYDSCCDNSLIARYHNNYHTTLSIS